MSKRKKPTKAQINAERKLLVECLPEEWADNWLQQFDAQNNLLIDDDEEPLTHCEFIRCRLEDLALGQLGWTSR